jgi:competence protein ComEC
VRDLETSGAVVSVGHAGVHGNLDDEAFRWRALWPTSKHPDMQTGNPGSLVIRAEWPRVDANEPPLSVMFLGDLDEDAQRALLSSTAIRPATVVKVAHHGSADQYDRLYLQLRARLALVSVGADNGYGHPTDRSLGILAQSGTAVARTDLHGLVLVRRVADTTGHRLEVWTER